MEPLPAPCLVLLPLESLIFLNNTALNAPNWTPIIFTIATPVIGSEANAIYTGYVFSTSQPWHQSLPPFSHWAFSILTKTDLHSVSGVRQAKAEVPALPFTSCEIVEKLFHLKEPQFSLLQIRLMSNVHKAIDTQCCSVILDTHWVLNKWQLLSDITCVPNLLRCFNIPP